MAPAGHAKPRWPAARTACQACRVQRTNFLPHHAESTRPADTEHPTATAAKRVSATRLVALGPQADPSGPSRIPVSDGNHTADAGRPTVAGHPPRASSRSCIVPIRSYGQLERKIRQTDHTTAAQPQCGSRRGRQRLAQPVRNQLRRESLPATTTASGPIDPPSQSSCPRADN